MQVVRILDKFNLDKVWIVKRYSCGTFYVNQEIKGKRFNRRATRMTKQALNEIGIAV